MMEGVGTGGTARGVRWYQVQVYGGRTLMDASPSTSIKVLWTAAPISFCGEREGAIGRSSVSNAAATTSNRRIELQIEHCRSSCHCSLYCQMQSNNIRDPYNPLDSQPLSLIHCYILYRSPPTTHCRIRQLPALAQPMLRRIFTSSAILCFPERKQAFKIF